MCGCGRHRGRKLRLDRYEFRTSDEGCANTLIVVTYIQRCQAEVQKAQAEELELHRKRMAHIDQNLAEITDKLNGLNGYVSGQQEVSQYTSTPRCSALSVSVL